MPVLTRDQFRDVLSRKPTHLSSKDVLTSFINRGNSIEGVSFSDIETPTQLGSGTISQTEVQQPSALQKLLGLKATGNISPEGLERGQATIETARRTKPSKLKTLLESFGFGTDPFGAAIGGVFQSFAKTGLGAGELGRRGLQAVVPEGSVREGLSLDEPAAALETFEDILKPQGKVQSAFKTGTDIMQFIGASGGVNRAMASIDKLGKVGKLLTFGKNIGVRPILEGLAAGTVSAAQRAEIDDNVKAVSIISAVFPVATQTISKLASFSKPIAKKVFSTAIGATDKLRKEGFKVDTIFDEDLGGRSIGDMFNNTLNKTKQLKDQARPLLEGQPQASLDDLISSIIKKGQSLSKNNVSEAGVIERSMNTAVENIKKRFSTVNSNAAVVGSGPSKINIMDLDDIRASYGEGATFKFGDSTSESAKKKVAKMIWGESKDLLENTVTSGSELNALRKRISTLIPVRQALQDKMAKNSKNVAFGLIDTIFLGGSLASGTIFNPLFLTAIALNKVQRSPATATLFNKIAKSLDTPPKAWDILASAIGSYFKKTLTES